MKCDREGRKANGVCKRAACSVGPGTQPHRESTESDRAHCPWSCPHSDGQATVFLTVPRASPAAGFLQGRFRSWHFWVPCEKMDKSLWYHGKLGAGKWRSASWGRKMPSGVGTGTAQQGTSEVGGEDAGGARASICSGLSAARTNSLMGTRVDRHVDGHAEVSELSLAGEDRAGQWSDSEAHIFPARLVET